MKRTLDEEVVLSLLWGLIAPLVVLAVWGMVIRSLVRESPSNAALWLIAVGCLLLPLAVFVAQKG
ncbi:MAG: hypothetical protein IPH03_09820 [Tetrasphaera sp.]|nr:hypothetical protein [Tetrasphaera sp.]